MHLFLFANKVRYLSSGTIEIALVDENWRDAQIVSFSPGQWYRTENSQLSPPIGMVRHRGFSGEIEVFYLNAKGENSSVVLSPAGPVCMKFTFVEHPGALPKPR